MPLESIYVFTLSNALNLIVAAELIGIAGASIQRFAARRLGAPAGKGRGIRSNKIAPAPGSRNRIVVQKKGHAFRILRSCIMAKIGRASVSVTPPSLSPGFGPAPWGEPLNAPP